MYCAPLREFPGQHVPLAATFEQVEHCAEHLVRSTVHGLVLLRALSGKGLICSNCVRLMSLGYFFFLIFQLSDTSKIVNRL